VSVLADVVRRVPVRLEADSARVVTRLFVPGQEGFDDQESRATAVLERILALDDDAVQRSLDDLERRFAGRHRDLQGTFRRHAGQLADRLDPERELTPPRRLLIGATFTSEYAIEGAALCNPSIVAAPDQAGVGPGSLRFVMSVRAIGEGHRSSIGFRSGIVDASGDVVIDDSPPFATTGRIGVAPMDAAAFRGEIHRLHQDGENADYVLDALGDEFTTLELEQRLARLQGQLATRRHGGRIIALIREIAERTYSIHFPPSTALTERVLWPAMRAESNGMEDARFVRFTDDDGTVAYHATYTAYDGSDISQQLLTTTDFATFSSAPIVGPGAANKGLALFPRRIGGHYAALSRADRESNAVVFTRNLHQWGHPLPCQVPARPWEVLQIGNCGSPIETAAGWLSLTHGVGPMRTYSIGATLLDLDVPTKVLGQLPEPLLAPATDEQDGYVPNVVYSCGALVHGDTLVLPYGIGDSAIGVATVPLTALIEALVASAV
jgi:predicted GH43/DUF377 family glycosyl hydrolase